MPALDARNEPDCTKSDPLIGHATTSPGSGGATKSWTPSCWAVKVFMKNDSPPSTARRRPFITPPWVDVCRSMPDDIATIAPASARTVSPAESVSRAVANAGA